MEIYDMFMKNRQLLGAPSDRISLLDKPTLSERAMIVTIDEVRVELMREIAAQNKTAAESTLIATSSAYDPE